MKKLFYILASLCLISLIILFTFYKGYLRFNYPSFSEYPIQGIDVSHHQKDIQWEKIDKKKVSFVFIKATEGGDFVDKKFSENWMNAKNQGFIIGAYHFFTFCRKGKEQAENFIKTVPKEVGTLPPVIDLEYGGNCKLTKSKEEILAEIDTLQSLLTQHYNKQPIFYVTQDFYNNFLTERFKEHSLWIRDIYKKPELGNRPWLFWQFGNRGHIKGIDMYTDLNVFKGSREDFEKLIY